MAKLAIIGEPIFDDDEGDDSDNNKGKDSYHDDYCIQLSSKSIFLYSTIT